MPCANAVARSCVRPVANAVDAISGLSRPPGSLIYSDFVSGLGGADPLLGYSLLGGQYEDGVLVGLRPACDDLAFAGLPGVRGMRTEGQITNLFGGYSSVARSVTLSAQVYTLQVFGAGSVTCSYGTATAASPLTFAATAGTTLFTPSGVSQWMLTATAYPVPYVPPGTTQTSTAHNGTNGIHYSMPQNGAIWNQLNGKPDGVELATNPATGGSASYSNGVFQKTNTSSDGSFMLKGNVLQTGDMGRLKFRVVSISGAFTPYISGGALSIINAVGEYTLDGVAGASTVTDASFYIGTSTTVVIDNVSIQKLIPQPLTLAARIVQGVGSADATTNLGVFTSTNSATKELFISGIPENLVESSDVTNTLSVACTWSRYEQLVLVMQVNTAGTQFRAGVYRVAAKTWSWSAWTAYDGSFNPSSVYQKLMLAFGNNYQMWHIRHWLADYQSSEADIVTAMGVA